MRVVSSQYDLTSGRKLFEPKTQSSVFNSGSVGFKNTLVKVMNAPLKVMNTHSPKIIDKSISK